MATKFYTFTGESVIEALKKARQECGEDAVLVTQKQVRAKGINQKPIFEVLVSVEENEPKENTLKPNLKAINYENAYSKFNQAKQNIKPKFSINEKPSQVDLPQTIIQEIPDYDEKDDESVRLSISKAAKQISEITQVNLPKDNENIVNKRIDDVAKQVNALNEKMGLIADMIWDEKASHRNNLAIPTEFASIYKAAKSSGMKTEHLEAIMQTTITNMPTSMKSNPTAVKRYFYSLLRNMLPCRSEKITQKQKIMMLVGPTGVGKTTTLAKLAARYAYSGEKRYKTGIITLDTYRIGAVEQLFQYAKMMRLPIIDVIEVDDFKNALKTLNHCDVILIDTTGNSQYDKQKLARLDQFLKNSQAQIDVNLVLSAGSKVEDLLEIYNGFSFLDIDTLVITKFDETKIFGNVFSLVYETSTPISFFSTGQEVPDDLMEAKSEFLIQCVLEGFNKDCEL